jgi:hypothetical protein
MYCCVEGIKGMEGGGGRKQENTEHTVVSNVALWNVGFQ